jgi:hypothetical protein
MVYGLAPQDYAYWVYTVPTLVATITEIGWPLERCFDLARCGWLEEEAIVVSTWLWRWCDAMFGCVYV